MSLPQKQASQAPTHPRWSVVCVDSRCFPLRRDPGKFECYDTPRWRLHQAGPFPALGRKATLLAWALLWCETKEEPMSTALANLQDQQNVTIRVMPAPPNAPPVIVRLPDGSVYNVPINAAFDEAAMQAAERVRTRRQWRKSSSVRQFMFRLTGDYLADLGDNPETELRKIARAGVVEVHIPAGTGESAFIFPWEFALTEITSSIRAGQPLLVIRHLDNGVPRAAAGDAFPVLIVQSAPGELGNDYSFESEHKVVTSSFGDLKALDLNNPTLEQLRNLVTINAPHTLHFAGVDGLQGAELLKLPDEGQLGLFLADAQGLPILVSPDQLADAATIAAVKPSLVAYNFYNSSWPIASQTVRKGAAAAVGFQDEIDDAIAELFFARLYEAWQRSGWDLLYGYREAWKGLSDYSAKLLGTGIVLWSATSLLPSIQSKRPSAQTSTATISPETILSYGDPRFADVKNAIEVAVEPCLKLNYSMLHNNRPLFNKFEVKRQASGRLQNVRVEVQLNTGSDAATYSTTFDLSRNRPIVDVSALARVSLTSDMTRSLRESVYTSLFVSVFWESRVVYQETFRVALLPPDEWRDDDLNRIWLPSFVLPRDAAITAIVDKAQKYLSVLQDDSGAGFDGYQGVLPAGTPMEMRCESVDDQVRSLWWALINEYQLGYINPPPSFTEVSQRLRTPSDVIEGRRGTCIDLTLLLAALLEYVDVFPVVFLLAGHAFPAYVRSEDSYAALRGVFFTPPSRVKGGDNAKPGANALKEWILDQRYYSSIVQLVRGGHLVPLESVALTQRTGFWDATSQGTENLKNKADFQFLVDIKAAREADVTPIPLWSIPR